MGIDVYLTWPDMTPEDSQKQATGFSILHGHVGYLREAYHGGPYASHLLFPEAWSENEDKLYKECESNAEFQGIPYTADKLRSREASARAAALERYSDNPELAQKAADSITAFCQLAEDHEKRTGEPCRVVVSY